MEGHRAESSIGQLRTASDPGVFIAVRATGSRRRRMPGPTLAGNREDSARGSHTAKTTAAITTAHQAGEICTANRRGQADFICLAAAIRRRGMAAERERAQADTAVATVSSAVILVVATTASPGAAMASSGAILAAVIPVAVIPGEATRVGTGEATPEDITTEFMRRSGNQFQDLQLTGGEAQHLPPAPQYLFARPRYWVQSPAIPRWASSCLTFFLPSPHPQDSSRRDP